MEFGTSVYVDGTNPNNNAGENTFLPAWSSGNWDALLQYTQTLLFSAGDTVVQAGSSEQALYIVAFGKVTMFVNARKRLKLVRPRKKLNPLITIFESGAVINVLAFFDGKPGIASYRAATDCQLLYLNLDAFAVFSARRPDLGHDVLFDLGRLLALQDHRLSVLLAAYGGFNDN